MRRSIALALALALGAITGCDSDDDGAAADSGTYELPAEEAESYDTAYIGAVVADPPGDDMAEGAGEHVVIRNNATIRIDMGGWWLDVDGERLPLGIGRQIDVGAELRVHPGPGTTGDDAVFVGLDEPVLDDDAGTVVLRDAAGEEVAELSYGGS